MRALSILIAHTHAHTVCVCVYECVFYEVLVVFGSIALLLCACVIYFGSNGIFLLFAKTRISYFSFFQKMYGNIYSYF